MVCPARLEAKVMVSPAALAAIWSRANRHRCRHYSAPSDSRVPAGPPKTPARDGTTASGRANLCGLYLRRTGGTGQKVSEAECETSWKESSTKIVFLPKSVFGRRNIQSLADGSVRTPGIGSAHRELSWVTLATQGEGVRSRVSISRATASLEARSTFSRTPNCGKRDEVRLTSR